MLLRCQKVRTAAGAYTHPVDKKSVPCRAYQVQFLAVEEPTGPQWGVADIMVTLLHECPFREGETYNLETLFG